MEILPAIDILDGHAVRLLRGDYDAVTAYDERPEAVAAAWAAGGATIVHVVDLEAARGGRPQEVAIRAVIDVGTEVQLGGGIRTPDDAARAIDAGAKRVVVGSALVAPDPAALEGIVERVGGTSVVGAIDVRAGRAVGHGWKGDGMSLAAVLERCRTFGVPRALVTGIEVDGTMDGPASMLLEQVRSISPDLGLIASGGVGTIDDLRRLAGRGDLEGVIVGRALYEGRFTVREAIEAVSVRPPSAQGQA